MKHIIYFLQRSNGDIKIGTTFSYKMRLSNLQSRYGILQLLGWIEGDRALESQLHRRFCEYRRDGEFFKPYDDLMRYIEQHAHKTTPENTRRQLPGASTPEAAYELLSDFAYENRLTMSEAVRTLLQASPPLVEFAAKKKVAIDFGVEAWRGSRGGGDD